MILSQAYHLLIFLSLTATSIATPIYSRRGCNDRCGDVRIPYPFGIGPKCSINQWYTVDCNYSTPYLSALNHLEVLGVNLEDQTVTVNTPTVSYCQNQVRNSSQTMSIDLGRSPFLFSKSHNKFVFEGCGNAVVMMDNGSLLTGCSTSCLYETFSERNDHCFGFSCCQATIPHHLKSYSTNVTGLGGDGVCGSAFLVDQDSYVKRNFSVAANNGYVPVSLMWTLTYSDTLQCCRRERPLNLELKMGNGTSIESLKCSLFLPDEGNPYLSYGCEEREECARCYDTYCAYDTIYDDDGSRRLTNITCAPYRGPSFDIGSKSPTGVILGNIFIVSWLAFQIHVCFMYARALLAACARI
ncbi:putative wall-associated receptor kinase, galacturonan-binding domain-containing protein [Helianthus debilis subsp. tardiflorus]